MGFVISGLSRAGFSWIISKGHFKYFRRLNIHDYSLRHKETYEKKFGHTQLFKNLCCRNWILFSLKAGLIIFECQSIISLMGIWPLLLWDFSKTSVLDHSELASGVPSCRRRRDLAHDLASIHYWVRNLQYLAAELHRRMMLINFFFNSFCNHFSSIWKAASLLTTN